ncbi:otoferlin-like [Anopheles stephensi]|uniref:otoferlin-like n=1 Tax=Anopheles stephensi TaxID=30069 RepID=UPI001658B516|nr:otoferlin-like [Anopheles stephensi]
MVSCNGKHKRTRIAYRTDNPYFNEYFSFSLYCSERKLRRKGIKFSLYRPSVCTTMHSCIGEFHVDLNTVWEQKNHGFSKKWASFEPIGRAPSIKLHCGYLLIDVSISCAMEVPSPIKLYDEEAYEVIESNRLLPIPDANEELQRVRYCCNIYRGEFVASAEYAVRVSYGGLKVRTKPSTFGRSFRWNEKLCFVGTNPSPNQIIGIDLLTTNCCYSNVKAAKDIHFSSLAMRTDDVYNLPTYGPAWLPLYGGTQDSQYVGRLLISISTEILSIQSVPAHKTQAIRLYEPLVESNYWEEQVFVIRFRIIALQLFSHLQPLHRMLVYLSCADIHSKVNTLPIEKLTLSRRSQAVRCVDGAETIFTIKVQLPDYRHKYFIQAALGKLCEGAEQLQDLLRGAMLCFDGKNGILSKREHFIRLLVQLDSECMRAHEQIAESTYKQHTKLDQVRKSHILQQLLSVKSELVALKTSLAVATNFEEASHVMLEFENMLNNLSKLDHDVRLLMKTVSSN